MEKLLLDRFYSTRIGLPVFKPIYLSLLPGQAYLCEGKNGSGKTTMLRSIVGLCSFKGTIIWNGKIFPSLKTRASYLSIQGGLRNYLRVQDHLDLWSELWTVSSRRQIEILSILDLFSYRKRLVITLSSGEQQRLKFALILFQKKYLWLLDEPLSHLDRFGVVLIRSLLRSHLLSGGIAILTRPSSSALSGSLSFSLIEVR